jgi:metal-responsive CopG/Arc/MetJ family transcriptional regulator
VRYTLGMKTAISIPDHVFRDAERLAERLKKSRSQLYSEAVAEYLARHEPESITDRINAVCDEVDTRPDPFLTEAARRILERTEW